MNKNVNFHHVTLLSDIYRVSGFRHKRCGGEIDILDFCFLRTYILAGETDNK